jgi:hypothetical protein
MAEHHLAVLVDGTVVLRDWEHRHITSRELLEGQRPGRPGAAVAAGDEADSDFIRPLRYPSLSTCVREAARLPERPASAEIAFLVNSKWDTGGKKPNDCVERLGVPLFAK